MKKVYLDYASSTPIDKNVLKEVVKNQKLNYANASSVHSLGRESSLILDTARELVSEFLNCEFNEVIFTSCATESNNLAIQGLVKSYIKANTTIKPHIITTKIEHPSVLNVIKRLEESGVIEVSWIDAKKDGVVDFEDIKKAVRDNTILVSVMYVNNETGVIQPIRKIGKHINKVNKRREKDFMILKTQKKIEGSFSALNKIYFHTDAVQAVNFLNMDVKYLHVDMLTISGHKMYAPKGSSVLYVNENVPLTSIMQGGGQELSLRPGTYNLPAIHGLSLACMNLKKGGDNDKISELKNYLLKELKLIKSVKINGDIDSSIAGILNISLPNLTGEIAVLKLDQKGVCVSAGSACSSGAIGVSHVLQSMGVEGERASNSIRISIGKNTTKKEIKQFIKELNSLLL